MKLGVYYVESTNQNGEEINRTNKELVAELAEMIGSEIEFVDIDHVNDCDLLLNFIGGGGTEGRFLQVLDKLPRPVFLLTTGANNSLAASMEILSYLNQHDIPGEIIHGSNEKMASRLKTLAAVFKARKTLGHFRIGRVGKPSDWLISSDVDNDASKNINGIEIVDIDIQELFDEIKNETYEPNVWTEMFMEGATTKKIGESKKDVVREKEMALYIYGAMKRICTKYELQGVTLRCFDLLVPIKATGCMALAILNAEGIYASCEGDTPALISMAVLGELTGQPVFQANPSRIVTDDNSIIFAHCTLPLNMPTSTEYFTHFESGLGVALRGKLKEGPVTIFKTSGLLDRWFVSKGDLTENLSERNLCRTQVKIHMNDLDYFLTRSIGNHHLIIEGDHVDLVNEFFKW